MTPCLKWHAHALAKSFVSALAGCLAHGVNMQTGVSWILEQLKFSSAAETSVGLPAE